MDIRTVFLDINAEGCREWYYLNLVTNTGHQPKKSGRNQDGHHPDDHHAENAVNFDNFYIYIMGNNYEKLFK